MVFRCLKTRAKSPEDMVEMNDEEPDTDKPAWTQTNQNQLPSLLSTTFSPSTMPSQSHFQMQQSLPILQQAQHQAKTLFDLFPLATTTSFVDPTITEKENSKPTMSAQNKSQFEIQQHYLKQQAQRKEAKKRKNAQKDQPEKDSKKMEKKRKYLESLKEKQKREIEWKEKCNETICKFFLEDRCTKGDECPFSHNADLISKKTEICKYYLTGYCGKGEKCIFMHAEFPCKFYHTGRGECTNLDKCRFSHEPLNETRRLALEKYLKEINDTSVIILPPNGVFESPKNSILGSPPRYLHDSVKIGHVQNTPTLMGKSQISNKIILK